ncbi:hypothetical protein [Corynebacterium ulceribovis]|uniref:hypothetical protein n=1 Tax=Corynebacterium ulceribovis TaxID=487732 RepID=UPI000380CCE6|nr:hypothetical protein [Corynebacterium ulceribovis]
MSDNNKWYYDLETGEVSDQLIGSWETRLGPYDSYEEAKHALDIAKQRNEAADDKEKAWQDDWDKDNWD